MAVIYNKYGSRTAATITLASLGSSSSLLAGQECTEIDNTSSKFERLLVRCKFKVGSSVTSGTNILVYAWGSDISAASQNLDTIAGADGARTITSAGIRNKMMALASVIDVDSTTASRTYYSAPFDVAQLFGAVPLFCGFWVTHNTGSALDSTGASHAISYMGINSESV